MAAGLERQDPALGCHVPFVSKALAIKDQVRGRDHFQANGLDALAFGNDVLVVMAEQVEPWPHGGQHFIDRCLACVSDAWQRKRTRCLVG